MEKYTLAIRFAFLTAILIGITRLSFIDQSILSQPKATQILKENGGIVITMDDKSVDEWAITDSIFSKKYNWKVTYFVSAFHKLKDKQKEILLQLQKKGNEIAYHGALHTEALPYIEKFSLEKYLEDEFAQLQPMKDLGLKISSFAYPSGSHNQLTDSILLKKFKYLRGVTNNETVAKNFNCFYQGKPLVYGIGIEPKYRYFSKAYLQSLLAHAKENNQFLIVYGHKPTPVANKEKHEIDYATLDFICQYVKTNGMKFKTMNELK